MSIKRKIKNAVEPALWAVSLLLRDIGAPDRVRVWWLVRCGYCKA